MYSALVVAQKFCDLTAELRKKDGKAYNLTYLKLLKLLYIAHGHCLALYDVPLFGDTIEAWQYGPVVPSVYHALKKTPGDDRVVLVRNVPFVTEEDVQSIRPREARLIEEVAKYYDRYTASQLVGITHDEKSPWHKAYYTFFEKVERLIDDEDTKKYYKDLLSARPKIGG